MQSARCIRNSPTGSDNCTERSDSPGPTDRGCFHFGAPTEKIRRALSVRHIDFRERRIIDSTLRRRIEWDEAQDGHLPLVVVDGKVVS